MSSVAMRVLCVDARKMRRLRFQIKRGLVPNAKRVAVGSLVVATVCHFNPDLKPVKDICDLVATVEDIGEFAFESYVQRGVMNHVGCEIVTILLHVLLERAGLSVPPELISLLVLVWNF